MAIVLAFNLDWHWRHSGGQGMHLLWLHLPLFSVPLLSPFQPGVVELREGGDFEQVLGGENAEGKTKLPTMQAP